MLDTLSSSLSTLSATLPPPLVIASPVRSDNPIEPVTVKDVRRDRSIALIPSRNLPEGAGVVAVRPVSQRVNHVIRRLP
jgi:hypothetical protein